MPIISNIKQFLHSHFTKIAGFFVIFYLVGIVGMLLPFSFSLFVKLIPLALLLSSVALAFFHVSFNIKTLVIFGLIYLIGFFIEVAGVNSGVIFGYYTYGDSLGIKAFNTPLLIGLNWLLLVYITASIFENKNWHPAFKIILSSSMMLAYDLIIEQIAPQLQMWFWQTDQVPLKNYFAWFFIALFFHILIKIFGINTTNKLAPVILICQILFFLILLIAFKF